MIILGGGACGRRLGHERPQSLSLLPCEGTARKELPVSQELGSHQTQICWHVDLELPSLWNQENDTSVVWVPPAYGILLWQPKWTEKTQVSNWVVLHQNSHASDLNNMTIKLILVAASEIVADNLLK